MNITIKQVTPDWLFRRACEMTMHGQTSKISLAKLAQCEHSPLRTVMFWVEIEVLPTFVSVHLARHHIGVEPFIQSMRDDLYIDKSVEITRLTPVRMGMLLNAQALINISRKRLCYKSHVRTVAVLRKLKAALKAIAPELEPFMVPECVYRNGYCPELSECKPGLAKVMRAYKKIPTVGK